jgi:hypothetical protein
MADRPVQVGALAPPPAEPGPTALAEVLDAMARAGCDTWWSAIM